MLARIRFLLLVALLAPLAASAQVPAGTEREARVEIVARGPSDGPVVMVAISAGDLTVHTDSAGRASLRLAPAEYTIMLRHPEYRLASRLIVLRPGQDTTLIVRLVPLQHELATVVVSVTRGERRIEDVPVRVELVEREEIEEKLLMTPGDVAMLLNETPGLRVQATSPALGGAGVRVQGLRSRYTLILTDNLPLHGAQSGGLGLLQIPPMDLERVEVVKGAASALHGAQALGGVINLVSRRPGEEHDRELLLNQTSRAGRDALLWTAGPIAAQWGYTLLAGAHSQDAHDVDGDAWADLPRHRRVLARPRVFWNDGRGSSALLTGSVTLERREGGEVPNRVAPEAARYVESLETVRGDFAGVATIALGSTFLGLRGAVAEQQHEHRFGERIEDDRHRTTFGEATLTVPGDRVTPVLGVAVQRESYRSADVSRFEFATTTPSLFAQAELDPLPWLSFSASGRVDAHDDYGTFVHPRVAILLRAPDHGALSGWTLRLSAGTATFAPTPFVEETEAVGLGPLLPLPDLRVERATTGSVDIGAVAGAVEIVATAFGSRVRDPIAVVQGEVPGTMALINSPGDARTAGGELVGRYRAEPWHVTASYTYVRATEYDAEALRRRAAPLVPRHAAGVVGMYEIEDRGRLGVELYHTGSQPLDDNPFRATAPAHVILGALGEWRVGAARLFLNLENLTNVRQSRWTPLVRATPGLGGRRTTDVWTELAGRTINGGVRVTF